MHYIMISFICLSSKSVCNFWSCFIRISIHVKDWMTWFSTGKSCFVTYAVKIGQSIAMFLQSWIWMILYLVNEANKFSASKGNVIFTYVNKAYTKFQLTRFQSAILWDYIHFRVWMLIITIRISVEYYMLNVQESNYYCWGFGTNLRWK